MTNENGRAHALPQAIDLIGGAAGIRTPGLRIANAALCQTELLPHDEGEYRFKFKDSSSRSHPQITQMAESKVQVSGEEKNL